MQTDDLASYKTFGMGGVVGQPHVYLIDDDSAVRKAIGWLLRSAMFRVLEFNSAEDFLRDADPDGQGCIILDVCMPGLGGLDLQRQLIARTRSMPVVFLSGTASVSTCAVAMKLGACDFLTKPVDEALLFAAVERAFARDQAQREERSRSAVTDSRLATLTPREREVIGHVMSGRLNKQIAAELGTAEKTVKVHRARAMEKMQVDSVAELVRTVLRAHPQWSFAPHGTPH
ncbi:response regulator [Comamonas antarctica]|uniref:response regulator transcription factor n=1 Tax=Comamonas antarctica TaxID=2743470 RepID=UPI0028E9DCF4|nr:response regulator [Comamonas antarctica]